MLRAHKRGRGRCAKQSGDQFRRAGWIERLDHQFLQPARSPGIGTHASHRVAASDLVAPLGRD
jgi:hypothetical protein